MVNVKKRHKEASLEMSQDEYFSKDMKQQLKAKEQEQRYSKEMAATIYVCDNFPVSFQDVMPVLQILANANPSLQQLVHFIKSDQFLKHFPGGFPVKLVLPLTFSIRAVITFQNF